MFELCEKEAKAILAHHGASSSTSDGRFATPPLAAYDFALKCSHFFNILDSRGAISTTERAALIARVRALCCAIAEAYCAAHRWGEASSPDKSAAVPAEEARR